MFSLLTTVYIRVYTVYAGYVQFGSISNNERKVLMEIYISNSSPSPLYEQIAQQIRSSILEGRLKEDEPLPSIRLLAKELRISVITTKRAYEDLEKAGFIYTVPGKGCFVAAQNPQLHREECLKQVQDALQNAVDAAAMGGITKNEVLEILTLLLEGE